VSSGARARRAFEVEAGTDCRFACRGFAEGVRRSSRVQESEGERERPCRRASGLRARCWRRSRSPWCLPSLTLACPTRALQQTARAVSRAQAVAAVELACRRPEVTFDRGRVIVREPCRLGAAAECQALCRQRSRNRAHVPNQDCDYRTRSWVPIGARGDARRTTRRSPVRPSAGEARRRDFRCLWSSVPNRGRPASVSFDGPRFRLEPGFFITSEPRAGLPVAGTSGAGLPRNCALSAPSTVGFAQCYHWW
jgi:hypothetical protein